MRWPKKFPPTTLPIRAAPAMRALPHAKAVHLKELSAKEEKEKKKKHHASR